MGTIRIGLILSMAACFVTANAVAGAKDRDKEKASTYEQHKDVQIFIRELSENDGFSTTELTTWFSTATKQQSIIDAISRPAERTLTWAEYRKRFITENRIEKGIDFWQQHQADLQRAAQTFGVPAEIIVAIIGVETHYGKNKGRHRVIDALSTLAFDYPPRSKFFRKELREFLLLSREQQMDPLKPLGSYAGAMGYGQFIPSSYRAYAIDFDGDGVVDIRENTTDAIGSVANYFKVHGWRESEPVVIPGRVSSHYNQSMMNHSLKPRHTIEELRDHGFMPAEAIDSNQPATAMGLQGLEGMEFWLGLHNFYVITRYNHSRLYAMAVWQLSQSIASNNPGTK